MDKQTKETIEKLKKEKQYDKIYEQFGNEAYRKNIPKRLRKQELKKLKQERKYFDIYNKYGTAEYEKVLIPIGLFEFGDLLCYERDTNKVAIYNHEQDKYEIIADNFNEFKNKLS